MEDFAKQVLVEAGIASRYLSHGLSILRQPRNVGREEAIARLLQKTSPNWFAPQKPRKPSRPPQPPSFIRGPGRYQKNPTLKLWVGHQIVPYSDKPGSEQFARLAALQHQDIDGIEPEIIGGELWLRAGGQMIFLLSNASPTEASDAIYRARMAIYNANTEEKE